MSAAGVSVQTGRTVNAETLFSEGPDVAIIATGAGPHAPDLEISDGAQSSYCVGCDARRQHGQTGRDRRLEGRLDWPRGRRKACRFGRGGDVGGKCGDGWGKPRRSTPAITMVGRLHKLGVRIRTHLRLFGADEDAVYFQDVLTGEPQIIDGYDTLVTALGHVSDDSLARFLVDAPFEVKLIGDALAPRTAEEAVYEGLQAGWTI